MATDWTSPKTSDTHANELAATRGRDESNARMDYTGDTNIPDGTIRWNKTNNRFEIWNATTSTWSVLSSKYLINVDTVDGYHAGNASGNVPVSNGTLNINLNADLLDGKHLSEIGGIWDVIIEDQKPKGTHGGNFESGAWRTRDLNTLVFNHNSLASLSNNRFTLPAGTYCIDWDAPAYNVNNHKSALYNYTGSTIVAYGTSASSFSTNSTTSSVGTTVITVTSSTTFEIRHICGITRDHVGFGIATDLATEIYTRVRIKKIA